VFHCYYHQYSTVFQMILLDLLRLKLVRYDRTNYKSLHSQFHPPQAQEETDIYPVTQSLSGILLSQWQHVSALHLTGLSSELCCVNLPPSPNGLFWLPYNAIKCPDSVREVLYFSHALSAYEIRSISSELLIGSSPLPYFLLEAVHIDLVSKAWRSPNLTTYRKG
jgi:hypothetical protein